MEFCFPAVINQAYKFSGFDVDFDDLMKVVAGYGTIYTFDDLMKVIANYGSTC